MSRAPFAWAMAVLLAPTALMGQQSAAQQQARLQGVVVRESTFEPIQDALVEVVGTDFTARTGMLGQFAIPDAPLGTSWVRVIAEGIPSVREQVDITAEGVVFLQFRMPEDVFALLDEIKVDVESPSDGLASRAGNALDLLALKVPTIARQASGDIADTDVTIRLRGYNSLNYNDDPLVVIDGAVVQGASAFDLLRQIPATDVASIDVLKGPAAAFHYPFAANGVIQITTHKN
jgi:hypothetical protein